MEDMCKVSVIMLSYNHEDFLAKAIGNVLKQKVNFEFEIIIHDDASQDNSAKIILEYVRKYPAMINPIIQSENQYSKKGINIVEDFLLPVAKGKYIALCECDDYWIDDYKLQKQVDFLESNQKYSAVTHNTKFVDHNDCEIDPMNLRYLYGPFKAYEHNVSFYWRYPSMYPGHTATLVFRRDIYANLNELILDDYNSIRANGDVKRNLLLLLVGSIYHMEDTMSCHRIIKNAGHSWQASIQGKNISGCLFLAYLDMFRFSEKHFQIKIRPYYQLFHTSLASSLKYIFRRNDENKRAFLLVRNEMKSSFHMFFIILKFGVLSLPTITVKLFRLDRYFLLDDTDN